MVSGARSRIARETGASEGIDAPGVGLASARGIIDDETRRLIPRVARGKAPRGARTASDGPAGMAKISAVSRISAATTDAGVDAQIETTRQRVRVDDARPNLPRQTRAGGLHDSGTRELEASVVVRFVSRTRETFVVFVTSPK